MCQLCSALGYDTHLSSSGATPGSVVSAGPAFSLGQIVDQLRTQWGGGHEGTYRAFFGSSVSYSISDYYPTNGPYSETNAFVMSAVMKNVNRLGFELWDDAIAINLNESFDDPSANITVNYAGGTQGDGTYARPYLGGMSSGYYQITAQQIWLNSTWQSHDQDSDMFYGSYGVSTFVHEIGHALGLSHPGTYNAGNGQITYQQNAEFAQDNRQFTIMSYFGGYNPATNSWTLDGTNLSYYFPSTPMVYDIAAIQATYGADLTTRAGNSTYGFNITADVAARSANGLAVYSFAQNAHPIFTIWDGGGIDTLDCSGYGANQNITLIAGGYSSIGGMNGNVGIAYNCTIENATGGSGFDTITGNSVGNLLRGNGGNDTIDGREGIDTAVFAGNRAAYTLTDLGGGSVRVTGPDGTDTLARVERLQFADQTITWPLAVNHTPVVTAPQANVTATAGQTIALSSLFRASDADGDALTYFVYDNNAGGGRIMLNGVVIPAGASYQMTAAQFAQATFVAGAAGNKDALAVQAFDGKAYSGWNTVVNVSVPAVNHTPVVTAPQANVTATAGQTIALSSLFRASDADGDALTYFVYDNNAGGGRIMLNGAVIPAGASYQMTAAQFAQATFVAGAAGSTDALAVQAFDGKAYSGWNTVANVSVPAGPADDYRDSLSDATVLLGQIAVSATKNGSLEVAGDRDWFAVQLNANVNYTFNLQGATGNGGTLTDPYLRIYDRNGALIASNDDINGATNRDSQLTYRPTTAGTYYVETAGYGDNLTGTYSVGVTAAANHAPTVITPSGTNVSTAAGQPIQLSALFSGSDLDGDTLSYYVYDSNTAANSGHVVVGGNVVPAQTITAMTAAQLAQATFVAGAAGTYDDILVQAFDGKAYSGWNSSVHVGVTSGNHKPMVGLPAGASVDANPGQSLALSSLFRGSDVDSNALSYYVYDSNPAANSGHFVVGGNVVAAQTITAMTAAQLAQATFVAGAAGIADDILVQAFDGQLYSGWNAGIHVFV